MMRYAAKINIAAELWEAKRSAVHILALIVICPELHGWPGRVVGVKTPSQTDAFCRY